MCFASDHPILCLYSGYTLDILEPTISFLLPARHGNFRHINMRRPETIITREVHSRVKGSLIDTDKNRSVFHVFLFPLDERINL